MTKSSSFPTEKDAKRRKRKLSTTPTTKNAVHCDGCERKFPSRNQLFKHLRATNNDGCSSSKTIQKSHDEGEVAQKRFVLIVAYLGKNYHGSARNDCTDSVPTTEGCLWKAIGEAFPEGPENSQMQRAQIAFQDSIATRTNPKAMTRSSRTDKGVSALGNVFTLMLPSVWSSEAEIIDRVNQHLPEDIQLLRAMHEEQCNVPQSFDARTNCEARRYRYFVPAKYLFHREENRREGIMDLRKRLKKVLLQWGGTHSFQNFTNRWKASEKDSQKRQSEKSNQRRIDTDEKTNGNKVQDVAKESSDNKNDVAPSFFRHILRCHVEDVSRYGETDFVIISIKGQSFLYHQIRKMMGTTIAVMNGSLPADFIKKAFQEDSNMSEEAPLAPSEGLVMVEAIYSKYCSKHKVEPIGIGSKLLYREKVKSSNIVAEKQEANRRKSWEAATAKLLQETQDFQKRVYDQVCQDQLRLMKSSSF